MLEPCLQYYRKVVKDTDCLGHLAWLRSSSGAKSGDGSLEIIQIALRNVPPIRSLPCYGKPGTK